MRRLVSKLVPQRLKTHLIGSRAYDNYMAYTYAKGLKRLDICAVEVAATLRDAGIASMEGKKCMEIGCGWNLSHALVYHLLGAREIVATDLFRHACPSALKTCLSASIDSVVRDHLAQFSTHATIRERLNRLVSITEFSFATLEQLGIKYVAPVDVVAEPVGNDFDFIYSVSVLEHVPSADVQQLLHGLFDSLLPGGQMAHSIHMEDHRNFGRPFDHLLIDNAEYDRDMQTSRGNRLRRSSWIKHFEALPSRELKVIKSFDRLDVPLPESVDSGVEYESEEDLRGSHLGMFVVK